MQRLTFAMAAVALMVLGSSTGASAQSLKGSRASMERQNQQAVSYGYSFLETPEAVSTYVSQGHLVKVQDTDVVELHNVSYPYARPEVKMFVERFGGQYYMNCGEKLTVTSLTRPIDEQPSNAASDSVHPTGMAVDMRVPSGGRCRSWLEHTLLSMEKAGVLDVTREHHPSHYHVAVFTHLYENYVASHAVGNAVAQVAVANTTASSSKETAVVSKANESIETEEVDTSVQSHIVRKGETLASIAEQAGVTTAELRKANRMHRNKVKAGQKLVLPAASSHTVAAAEVQAKPHGKSGKHNAHHKVSSVSQLTHKVRAGETLWRIASHYGTSAEHLKKLNGLKDDELQVGQVLRISSIAHDSLASNEP